MSVCNIFKAFDSANNNGQGIFLTFSQYTEDLTSQNADPNNYRVVPSKFLCLDLEDFSYLDAGGYSPDPNNDLPYCLQSYYENCMAHLRKNYSTNLAKETATKVLFKTFERYGLLSKDTISNRDYYKEIVCGDEINVISNRAINGTNYDEIYCLLDPSKTKIAFYKSDYNRVQSPITVDGDDAICILGWNNNSTSGPYPTYPESITGISSVPITDPNSQYDDSGVLIDYLNDVDPSETYEKLSGDSFAFNCILVFYDIFTGNNVTPTYRGLPLGIWFSGPYDNGSLLNPVIKFVRSDTIFGQGTSYGLRICLKNVSSPFGVDIAVELTDSEEPIASLSELCDVFAQSVVSINNLAAVTNMNMTAMKDWASQFVNARVNVPYIREIGGVRYWFVNGRNIGEVGIPQNVTQSVTIEQPALGSITIEEEQTVQFNQIYE